MTREQLVTLLCGAGIPAIKFLCDAWSTRETVRYGRGLEGVVDPKGGKDYARRATAPKWQKILAFYDPFHRAGYLMALCLALVVGVNLKMFGFWTDLALGLGCWSLGSILHTFWFSRFYKNALTK